MKSQVINAELDALFDAHKYQSYTFDDMLILPGLSDVYPHMIDLRSQITRNVFVRKPIIGAAMETVTEARAAIALAKVGGLGVIHRLLEPHMQAEEVQRVKYETNKIVKSPITKRDKMKVWELLEWSANRKKAGKTEFDTHPIEDEHGCIVGIVGGKNLRYCQDHSTSLGEIMTPRAELVKAEPGTSPADALRIMHEHKVSALPLIDGNWKLRGMYVLSDLERKLKSDGGGYNLDDNGQLVVAASIGTGEKELERAHLLVQAGVNVLVIDTAHGHSMGVAQMIRQLKHRYPQVDVLAGNVATAAGAEHLILHGADGIKVGIGPGSICTTRVVSGVGVPQISAIYHCARMGMRHGVPVCADGGIKNTGDMVKALVAGAHTVMLGSLLAGTEESPGELRTYQGREVKTYRGMGSQDVMRLSGERYRQNKDDFIAEGITSRVPFRGSVSRVMNNYVLGIKSGLGYIGATTIDETHRKGMFTIITGNGLRESYPHDVYPVEEIAA